MPAVTFTRARSPLVLIVVVPGLLPKFANDRLPVPVKLTVLPALGVSVMTPPALCVPLPWVIAPVVVTANVPVEVLPLRATPPTSLRAMVLPVAPIVR